MSKDPTKTGHRKSEKLEEESLQSRIAPPPPFNVQLLPRESRRRFAVVTVEPPVPLAETYAYKSIITRTPRRGIHGSSCKTERGRRRGEDRR